ncbi:MAG: hypothetical protein LBQ37_02415 [Elusimicrobiota bacterium]|jgi:hypothetical protein|nr:hypothetical protein [Elusimicrobiota bacterium]
MLKNLIQIYPIKLKKQKDFEVQNLALDISKGVRYEIDHSTNGANQPFTVPFDCLCVAVENHNYSGTGSGSAVIVELPTRIGIFSGYREHNTRWWNTTGIIPLTAGEIIYWSAYLNEATYLVLCPI